MRKLVEFQVLDCNANHYGIDLSDLMDNAGRSIADYISNNYNLDKKISIVCGRGNNGGDGDVAAYILSERGFEVWVFQLSSPSSAIANVKYQKIKKEVHDISALDGCRDKTDILVDCLLGSGIKGEPKSPYEEYIEVMNGFDYIISVDIASGTEDWI